MELQLGVPLRVLLVSNLISPHQLPFAKSLVALLGEEQFRFAATHPMDPELGKRGWRNDEPYCWILRAGENALDLETYDRWWKEADVVLTGERDLDRITDRVRQGRMTFYMSERWWKPPLGSMRLLYPGFAWMALRFSRLARSPHFHFLAIGSHAAEDLRRIASLEGRAWSWGYFTQLPPAPACLERKGPLCVLWAGRMIACKRLDTLIRAHARIKGLGAEAHLTLVGHGPCQGQMERLTQHLGTASDVTFLPTMTGDQTRAQMRQAHVYVLASNAYEGWGAVLNEAMSEGCAVITSESAGAARSLIRHGENGLLFRPGDHHQLAGLLESLNQNEPLRYRLAQEGQGTIQAYWNPAVAAERFLEVARAQLSGQVFPAYATGPMSPL